MLPNVECRADPTLPKVLSDGSVTTPDDVDPDSLSAGLQTSTDDDERDPKTIVDKNHRGNSFESSGRDLDSDDFDPECSFRDKEVQSSACHSVCPSRASVDSHKSISFFIDLVILTFYHLKLFPFKIFFSARIFGSLFLNYI